MWRSLWEKGFVLLTKAGNSSTKSFKFYLWIQIRRQWRHRWILFDQPIRVKCGSIKLERTSRKSLPQCWQLNRINHHQHCFEIILFFKQTVLERKNTQLVFGKKESQDQYTPILSKVRAGFCLFRVTILVTVHLTSVIKKNFYEYDLWTLKKWKTTQLFFRGIRVGNSKQITVKCMFL